LTTPTHLRNQSAMTDLFCVGGRAVPRAVKDYRRRANNIASP
jgi:hypothetical protein